MAEHQFQFFAAASLAGSSEFFEVPCIPWSHHDDAFWQRWVNGYLEQHLGLWVHTPHHLFRSQATRKGYVGSLETQRSPPITTVLPFLGKRAWNSVGRTSPTMAATIQQMQGSANSYLSGVKIVSKNDRNLVPQKAIDHRNISSLECQAFWALNLSDAKYFYKWI